MANVSGALDLKKRYSLKQLDNILASLHTQVSELQGACVYVVGAGEIPHSGALSDPVELSIYEFWSRYFRLAHARLMVWSSSVDWPLTCPPAAGSIKNSS